MLNRLQLRSDSLYNWERVNPVLFQGEPGFDSSSRKLKIGDGKHSWNNLPWMRIGSQLFDFYVSESGDDTWDGQEGAPFRTLSKAIDVINGKTLKLTPQVVSIEDKLFTFQVDSIAGISVGDYCTSNIGYGFVSEIQEKTVTVSGTFNTEDTLVYVSLSKKYTILCTGSLFVTEGIELPPFVEITNNGYISFQKGLFLQDFAIFSLSNNGVISCEDILLQQSQSASRWALQVSVMLGISDGVHFSISAEYLSIDDTLSPSVFAVSGEYGLVQMQGSFTCVFNLSADSVQLFGRYSVSGDINGSTVLNGLCYASDFSIGSDASISMILCPVVGSITKRGIVKDLNS